MKQPLLRADSDNQRMQVKLSHKAVTHSSAKRRGIAATEFAICLPMLILILMGILETCSMIFLKQSLAVAAYEGSHRAVVPNATAAEVTTVCTQILADRNVNGAIITVIPSDLSTINPGEFLEIRITASADDNAIVPLSFFSGRTLQSSAVLMKEI